MISRIVEIFTQPDLSVKVMQVIWIMMPLKILRQLFLDSCVRDGKCLSSETAPLVGFWLGENKFSAINNVIMSKIM